MLTRIIGKPDLLDKLDPSLAAKLSRWIAEDCRRAQERKKARRRSDGPKR